MVPRLNREPGAGRGKLPLSRGFPRDPAKKRHPSQMIARITTPGRAKVWRVFSVLRCQWGAHRIRGKRLIIGGCHHMPRRCEKPRLRRSFALPAPGFPAEPRPNNVILEGAHRVRGERLIIGGATICGGDAKSPGSDGASPYLRRGFSRGPA